MEFLTLDEVAKELGISKAGVKARIWNKAKIPRDSDHPAKLRHVLIGQHSYVERKELERFKAFVHGRTSFTLEEISEMTGKPVGSVAQAFAAFPQYQVCGRRIGDEKKILPIWVVQSILELLGWKFSQEILDLKIREAEALEIADD